MAVFSAGQRAQPPSPKAMADKCGQVKAASSRRTPKNMRLEFRVRRVRMSGKCFMTENTIPVTDKNKMEKAREASSLWQGYFSGKDVKLGKLLSTLSIADVIDRDALPDKINLVIERTWTVETMLPVLPVMGALNGIDINVDLRPYGVLHQELLNQNSHVYKANGDFLLLLWQLEDFLPDLHASWSWSLNELNGKINDVADRVLGLLKIAGTCFNGRVLAFDFGVDTLLSKSGILDSIDRLSPAGIRREINERIRVVMQDGDLNAVSLLNLEKLQYRLGFKDWQDERLNLTAKCPVSSRALISIFHEVVTFIDISIRKPRKVLVLDCDNTLWDGVLGEDGISGVQIGPEYPGNVFAAIQKRVLQFAHRGVVIALCSKNDERIVRDLFNSHSGMVLKEKDITAWVVNWGSKSNNIKTLAVRLNLSLDSMVFVDDSPVEREEIRRLCPGVLVPEPPSDPMGLYEFWMDFDPFDRISLSREDRTRGQAYKDEGKRQALKSKMLSLDDFYRELDMRCRIWKAGDQDVQRIVQMSQRTNQFNTTTVRMTDPDVLQLLYDSERSVYLLQLTDKFGESGTVGCAVVCLRAGGASLEQFMMSCRVLKRTVEHHFLGLVMREVQGRTDLLTIQYVPTERNGLVKEFLDDIAGDLDCEGKEPLRLKVNESNAERLTQLWIKEMRKTDG